jgi:hypothetical protein
MAATNAKKKILQYVLAAWSMCHFRVKLNAIDVTRGVAHCGGRGIVAVSHRFEGRREFEDTIAVAHPDTHSFIVDIAEYLLGVVYVYCSRTIFAPLGFFDRSSQLVRQELHAVAYAEQRDAEFEYARIGERGVFVVYARGTSGEDNSLWLEELNLLQAHVEGMDFTVDMAFPYSARNQLSGLGAEIQNKQSLFVQMIEHFISNPLGSWALP